MPYKFLTDVTLARDFGISVDELLRRIKAKKIKCIVLKEQIVIKEDEYAKHRKSK